MGEHRLFRKQFHEEQERNIRGMQRQLDQLYKQKEESVRIVKLNPPRFWGYTRTFVLRKDVENSPEGPLYKKILKMINVTWYSRDKTFKSPMVRYGGFMGIPWNRRKEQHVEDLTRDEWEDLDSYKEKDLFVYKEYWNEYSKKNFIQYEFAFPSKLKMKVRKHFIYKEKYYDSSIDSQIEILNRKLYQERLIYKLDHYRYRDPFKKKKGKICIFEPEQ